MKQITLIVPDTIDHVIGSSRSRKLKPEEVTMDNLKKALCDRSNYHQYYYFQASGRREDCRFEIADCRYSMCDIRCEVLLTAYCSLLTETI
jgi:hypothetical protein